MSDDDFRSQAHEEYERHGQGVMVTRDGKPLRATGCLLADGSVTDAECLFPYWTVPDETHYVWTRGQPGSIFRRRGRLSVDPGKALYFIDELNADLISASDMLQAVEPNLERDLNLSPLIRDLVRSELFGTLLFGALSNFDWRHKVTGTVWNCGWRYAGGIVGSLRCAADFSDCFSLQEVGFIDEQVLTEIAALGWEPVMEHANERR
jgi:hypothetical protein